jgi:hypothetical protein
MAGIREQFIFCIKYGLSIGYVCFDLRCLCTYEAAKLNKHSRFQSRIIRNLELGIRFLASSLSCSRTVLLLQHFGGGNRKYQCERRFRDTGVKLIKQ